MLSETWYNGLTSIFETNVQSTKRVSADTVMTNGTIVVLGLSGGED